MALINGNKLYPSWKNQLLQGDALAALNSAEGATGVAVALIDADIYTYNDSHANFSDLTGVVDSDEEILNKTQVAAVFDGDNVTFTGVSGATIEAIAVYRKNAGANTTWPLIAYIEQGSVTNLPLTPNGGDITVLWNPLGIFKI